MNPVRNSSPVMAGLESKQGILSNGVNEDLINGTKRAGKPYTLGTRPGARHLLI